MYLEKAAELKEELDKLRPLDKVEEARIMQKFRLDWDYHSNHLEGNLLTYGETKALILFGITAQGKPLKDHIEITGHDEAIKWILDIVKKDQPLTEHFIRQLHHLLLKEPYEKKAITPDGKPTTKTVHVGEYKKDPNNVETITGEIFYFASPQETPALMNDLMKWYKQQSSLEDINPVLLASEFHYRFIRIHPFDDGNGRTARILMNFILMEFDYPPVIIKTEDKINYFAALRQADGGIIGPFIEYIAQNLVRSLELMIAGAKGENIDEIDDFDKEIALLNKKVKTAGENIKVSKTRDVLLKLYDYSIVKLIKLFIENCSRYDQFYRSHRIEFLITSDGITSVDNENWETELRNNIKEIITSIQIRYYYAGFKQSKISSNSYDTSLICVFDNSEYSVTVDSTYNTDYIDSQIIINSVKIKYGIQINDQESKKLVKYIFNRHKDYIEKIVKLAEGKN